MTEWTERDACTGLMTARKGDINNTKVIHHVLKGPQKPSINLYADA